MSSSRIRSLALGLIVAFAVASTFTRADSSSTSDAPPDRGRFVMPFGFDPDTHERLLSFEDQFDEEDGGFGGQSADSQRLSAKPEPEKAWLLEPGTFNRLSSAGQRAALLFNGRLHTRGTSRPLVAPKGEVSAEAAAGDNIRVNNPALDTTFHTHSETSIAVNGSNIIVSFNEFAFDGYSVSNDGGNTFTHKRIPTPTGGSNLGDGVVSFGPNGELYYATLARVPGTGTGTKSIIGVAKSTDNGATFSQPVDASTIASNNNDFQDKEWVAVDRNPSSPNKGNVYVSWTDFRSPSSNGNFISLARSTNGGGSFGAPVVVSPQDGTQSVQGSMPVVAPNGDLYVVFRDTHSAIGGMGIVKSTDGGVTFSAEISVAHLSALSTITGGGGVRTNSFPNAAVDSSGNLYVVFGAFTTGQTLDRGDVYGTRSTDGGVTFSTPVKINDDTTNTSQILPSVAVASDGTIGVKWWDRRNDPINDSLTDVYMATSTNGGASFRKNFRVTNHNWTFAPIEIGFASGYHGDYDGIAADGANFYLSWSDERNGEADAFFAQEPVNRDPNAADLNLSASKTFDNVIAGNSVAFDVSTGGANGFSGNLSLSAAPVITGLGYNFASSSVSPGSMASLNASTSTTASPGSYLITVSGTGSGMTRKTNLRLNVFDPSRFVSAPVNASRTPGFTSMQAGVRVDTGGTIHLAYDDDSANVRSNEVFYRQSNDGGMTFSAPIKVSGSLPLGFESTLALDSADNPYIAFSGFNAASGIFSVFLSKSTNHGATFTAPVVASGASADAENAKLVVDKNGNIFVTYIDLATSGTPVFVTRSTDGGASFSAPMRVSQPGEGIGNPPFIAVDSTGAAYVIYQDSAQSISTIKLAIAAFGQGFGVPKIVSDVQFSAFAPQIAIDKNGNVLVTFYNRLLAGSIFNREVVVIQSTDKGNTFGPQVNVSNNAGQSTFPSLILGAQGQVALVWEDTTFDPQRDVLAARSTNGGVTFEAPINLSANAGVSFGAFGGADSSGNLFVGWTDDSGANTDLFLAKLPASGTGQTPDFALVFNPSSVTVDRGTKPSIDVVISRLGGFNGSVTVSGPNDTGSGKIRLLTDPIMTTGTTASFRFKVKGGAPTGPRPLVFTAVDATNRTRTATLTMVVQ